MEILLNHSVPEDSWRKLISRDPHASPFQTPGFYKLFNSVNNLSAIVIAVSESDSLKALAVITVQRESGIKGYFSKRGILYGGPIVEEGNFNALDLLLKQTNKLLFNKGIYLETRNYSDYSAYKEIFQSNGYEYNQYVNFHISTGNLNTVEHLVSKSRIRQIRKARKNSVIWQEAQNVDEVEIFYNILLDLYKRKVGKPLFSFDFFRNFFHAGLGKYLLVWYNNKIIGGIMCPILEKKAIYEFYVCGLDDEYKEQHPSVMATWAAIEYACMNNIPVFDFMGAGKPDEQYGVREFKARFGGELVEYGRFIKVNNHFLYNLGKLGLKVKSNFAG